LRRDEVTCAGDGSDVDRLEAMVNINITAALRLAHAAVEGFVARSRMLPALKRPWTMIAWIFIHKSIGPGAAPKTNNPPASAIGSA
jgi:hypothetical protein